MIDTSKILKTLRKKCKMTTEEAAEKSGYSRYTIYCREKGKKGGFNSFVDLLDTYGYELKVVPKGMFESDIIEFTNVLPDNMIDDMDATEEIVAEFGRSKKSEKEYLILGEYGNMFCSRLYLFDDGTIEEEGYYNEKPIAWMEAPKCKI